VVAAVQKHTLGCHLIATNNFISLYSPFGLWFRIRIRIKRFQLVECQPFAELIVNVYKLSVSVCVYFVYKWPYLC